MTCKHIDAFLDQQWSGSEPPVPREVSEHIDGCEACRNLLLVLRRRSPEADLSGRAR